MKHSSKHYFILLILLIGGIGVQTTFAQFAGGTGTSDDPYIITTPAQLNSVRSYRESSYKLANDIDLTSYLASGGAGYNDGAGWQPIGINNSYAFTGSFNGDGHKVSGLWIDRSTTDYVGLFGYVFGKIKDIGVEINNSKGGVVGRNSVGGLVGANYGTISNSYAMGNVSGSGNYVGGLAGSNSGTNSSISNSYATGNVSGTRDSGGLVGANSSTINNSYAKGSISGDYYVGGLTGSNTGGSINNSYAIGSVNGNYNVGGLIGYTYNNTVSNSYYDKETSGTGDVYGTLKTSAEMKMRNTYEGWDFEEIWDIDPVKNDGYPYLLWQNPNYPDHLASATVATIPNQTWTGASITPTSSIILKGNELKEGTDFEYYSYDNNTQIGTATFRILGKGTYSDQAKTVEFTIVPAACGTGFADGTGTENDPYKITEAKNLDAMSNCSSSDTYYELQNDIDLGGYITNSMGWQPISFSGKFNGNGYKVSGLWINRPNTNQIGLFSYNSGTIENIGVEIDDSNGGIRGFSNVGGLAGSSYYSGNSSISISNSYTMGNVTGISNVGGLVGNNTGNCTISNNHTMGNVTGNSYVGGLVGYNSNGTISNSNATGNVTGNGYVGGLAGVNYGTINGSYATGSVNGSSISSNYVGGLVGDNINTINNSYAKGSISGDYYVGGLTGNNTGGSINNSYAIGSVNGNYQVGGLIGYTYNSTVSNSYYNIETNGSSITHTTDSRTTLQMQNKSNYASWDFETIWYIDRWFNDGMPYLQWQNELREAEVEPTTPQLYTGFPITNLKPKIKLNGEYLKESIDFEYSYGENINVPTGIIYIVGKKYYGSKMVNFEIRPSRIISAYWFPQCGHIYEYDGDLKSPQAFALINGEAVELNITGAAINAGIGIAKANLPNAEEDMILLNDECIYSITPKILPVSWAPDSVFTYNKTVQAPVASVSEPNVSLLRSNAHSAAGIYRGENAAYVEIEDQEQARNYTLTNRAKNYEITKKPLKPYFSASMQDFRTNAKTDTLWVPNGVFSDLSILQNTLDNIIDYEGFVSSEEGSDNESDLKGGKPKVEICYHPSDGSHCNANNSQGFLAKRVETTQKAVAVINTDNVSADNYSLMKPSIVIMETIEEDEEAEKVFCRLGNNCAQFSEEVCSIIGGEAIESCNIRMACVINNICIESTTLGNCTAIGGVAENSCGATPILNRENPQIGVIGVQTTYYNLKGEPLGATKPTTPGIYIEKSGSTARKVLAK